MARDETTLHVNRAPNPSPVFRVPHGDPESRVGFSECTPPAFLWLPAQHALCMPRGDNRVPPDTMGQKKGRGRGANAPATTSKARASAPPLHRRLTQLLRHGLERARLQHDDGWTSVAGVIEQLHASRVSVMTIVLEDQDRYEHDPRLDTIRATRKRTYVRRASRAPSGSSPGGACCPDTCPACPDGSSGAPFSESYPQGRAAACAFAPRSHRGTRPEEEPAGAAPRSGVPPARPRGSASATGGPAACRSGPAHAARPSGPAHSPRHSARSAQLLANCGCRPAVG